MDSGRFILAIVLTIAIIVGTNLLFPPATPPPSEGPPAESAAAPERVEQPAPSPVAADAGAQRPDTEPGAAIGADVADDGTSEPAVGAATTESAPPPADTVTVASPLYRYGISTRGAAVVLAELREYESFTRPGPVELVPDEARALLSYRLRVGERTIDLSRWEFEVRPEGGLTLRPGTGPDTLRLVYRHPETDFAIHVAYIFRPGSYEIGVRGRVSGLGGAPAQLLLDVGPALAANEVEAEQDLASLTYVVNSAAEGLESVSLEDLDGERIEEGPLRWTALRNKYFLAAAVSEGENAFGGLIASDLEGEHTARLTTTLAIGRDERFAYGLYLGPQEYDRLATVAPGLENVNPVAWEIFRPILRPLVQFITWALTGLHDLFDLGYGWVLILFGVLMRVGLWPLYAKAQRSQLKNMEVQPKLKEIQEKHSDDPEKLQKEMMRLYKEEGFNPLGGCLPMLVPYPVLITLFFVFQQTIVFRGVEFLWLPDLSRPDPYYLLPIILGLSMFITQWLNRRASSREPNTQMKLLMYGMPLFMVVIFVNLAAGLNLYYAASNLAAIPQQLQVASERARVSGRVAESPAGD